MKYGYARVSSKTQDYAAQVDALNAAGCDRIFSEKKSGKSAKDRPEFNKLMKVLLPGDTVVVTKLDRLARSSRDLHKTSCTSCKRSPAALYRLMLTIMGGIAEFERGLIRKRCEEGIERARAKGTQFGRPRALEAGQKRVIADRYAAGKTIVELAEEYECGVGTIWRALDSRPRGKRRAVKK